MSLDVAAAVAATVAAGSAHVASSLREDGPLGPAASESRGVADFARRRVLVHEPRFETTHIFDGDVRYFRGARERWDRHARGDPAWPFAHPLWPLDAGLGWGELEHVGTRQRRGATVQRYTGTIGVPPWTPPAWFRRIWPPKPGDEEPRTHAVEVCTDGHGRIRLAAVRAQQLDFSAFNARQREVFEVLAGSPDHPRWLTVEYWRFGADAAIEVPREDEMEPAFGWRDLEAIPIMARFGWRYRREIREFFRRGH